MARILIVDDDDLVREIIARTLQDARHDTLEARNGRQALDILDREVVDLAISDILMPEIDGLGLILAIRKQFPNLNVLCISGGRTRDMDYLGAAEKLGAQMVLRKPFTPMQLLAAVEAVLSMSAPPNPHEDSPARE